MAFVLILLTQMPHQTLAQQLDENTFADVTVTAGIEPASGETMGVSWVDVNMDGWPDLWMGNHYYGHNDPHLYLNLGNGAFVNVIEQVWSGEAKHDTHGGVWADFDNDGDPDLIELVGAGAGDTTIPNYFWVNEGGVLLSEEAEIRGLDYGIGRNRMALWFDWDNDGLLDIIMTTIPRPDGQGPSALFRQRDDHTFEEVTETAGFEADDWTFIAQLSDLSGDGKPDLIIHTWNPYPQRMYQGGTVPFVDIADEFLPTRANKVEDVAIADFNGDLYPDMYWARRDFKSSDFVVANEHLLAVDLFPKKWKKDELGLRLTTSGAITLRNINVGFQAPILPRAQVFIGASGRPPAEENPVIMDLSPADPTTWGMMEYDPATDEGLFIGYSPEEQAWTIMHSARKRITMVVRAEQPVLAVTPIAFDSAAIHDLLLTYDPSRHRFVNRTLDAGLYELPTGCTSAAPGDFDNDMDVDIYLSCASSMHVVPNMLLENLGDGSFRVVSEAGGALGDTFATSFGAMMTPGRVAVADYDSDGFLDLIVPGMAPIFSLGEFLEEFPAARTHLYRNRGNSNHWLEIDLEGVVSNRDGIGARVYVTAGGKTQLREQGGGLRRYVQDHPRLHFGLGSHARVEEIMVWWPSGKVQRMRNLDADRVLKIREKRGRGMARPFPPLWTPPQRERRVASAER